jgi:hypothetical protein
MTVVCPNGHTSTTSDYCDQCGARLEPAAVRGSAVQATTVLPQIDDPDTAPAARREPCPTCGAPRSGDDRYCEECGHDFVLARPAAGAGGAPAGAAAPSAIAWEVVVSADRSQYDRNATAGIAFPADYGEWRFALEQAEVRIGRSRRGSGGSSPEIDLAGAPVDPGISRAHAALVRQPDGSYAVVDLGSTNGTTVNDDPTLIGAHSPVPLADGDRVHLGAWTTITMRRR